MFWAVSLGLAVLILLLVPLSVEISTQGRTPDFRVRPAWGPLRFSEVDPRHSGPGKPREARARASGRRASRRKLRALLGSPGFVASLARLARRLLRHARPRHLRLRLKLGLGDPAETGRVWGALAPLFVALTRLDADELTLEPDFLRRRFELEVHTVIRVVPAVVLAFVTGYFLSAAPWRALARVARASA